MILAKAVTRPVNNEGDTPAHFSACYLLGKDEHELIRLLKE